MNDTAVCDGPTLWSQSLPLGSPSFYLLSTRSASGRLIKEGLYKIWCGVNTLDDSGVNTPGDSGVNTLDDSGVNTPGDSGVNTLGDSGVNTLDDSGVNTPGDASALVNPTVQLLLTRRGKIRMDAVGIVFEFYIAPL